MKCVQAAAYIRNVYPIATRASAQFDPHNDSDTVASTTRKCHTNKTFLACYVASNASWAWVGHEVLLSET